MHRVYFCIQGSAISVFPPYITVTVPINGTTQNRQDWKIFQKLVPLIDVNNPLEQLNIELIDASPLPNIGNVCCLGWVDFLLEQPI